MRLRLLGYCAPLRIYFFVLVPPVIILSRELHYDVIGRTDLTSSIWSRHQRSCFCFLCWSMTQCLSWSLGVRVSQFSCLHILTHSTHALKHTLETHTHSHTHSRTHSHKLLHLLSLSLSHTHTQAFTHLSSKPSHLSFKDRNTHRARKTQLVNFQNLSALWK